MVASAKRSKGKQRGGRGSARNLELARERGAAAPTPQAEQVVVELGAVAVAVQKEAPRVLVRRAGSIPEAESRSV